MTTNWVVVLCLTQHKYIISQFWRPEVQNQGVSRAALSLEALRKNPSLLPPTSDGYQHSLASLAFGHIVPLPGSAHYLLLSCVSQSSLHFSFIRILVVRFGSHLENPGQPPHLKILNYICKDSFSKQGNVHSLNEIVSQIPGIRTWTYVLGGHYSTHYRRYV